MFEGNLAPAYANALSPCVARHRTKSMAHCVFDEILVLMSDIKRDSQHRTRSDGLHCIYVHQYPDIHIRLGHLFLTSLQVDGTRFYEKGMLITQVHYSQVTD